MHVKEAFTDDTSDSRGFPRQNEVVKYLSTKLCWVLICQFTQELWHLNTRKLEADTEKKLRELGKKCPAVAIAEAW